MQLPLLGENGIFPGKRIVIKAVDSRFSGTWLVERVVHDCAKVQGGFTTTVHLKRNKSGNDDNDRGSDRSVSAIEQEMVASEEGEGNAEKVEEKKEEAPSKTQEPAPEKKTPFKYEHNPSDNPKVLEDALEDPNAVYGYSPSPNSKTLSGYANNPEEGIDWSNPEKVEKYKKRREEYHKKNDNIDELVLKMRNEGCSSEEIARAANKQRNQNRLNDYIKNNDMAGLERVKKRNLEKYGHEFGLDADDAFKKYGDWEIVIEKTKSANPGMDACCGLYDKYFSLYGIK